jgi:REP element-mobilizing transposase RayT
MTLNPSKYYHIYNHANGFENIFNEERNDRFFLEKYQFYISPIADTLAYCLMPNHFHLVIHIRKREVIEKQIQNKSTKFNDDEIAKYLSNQILSIKDFVPFIQIEDIARTTKSGSKKVKWWTWKNCSNRLEE